MIAEGCNVRGCVSVRGSSYGHCGIPVLLTYKTNTQSARTGKLLGLDNVIADSLDVLCRRGDVASHGSRRIHDLRACVRIEYEYRASNAFE